MDKPTVVDLVESKRRKAYCIADELGLTRDERIEMARVLLWRDVTSWGGLSDSQMERLLDAMQGFQIVVEIFRQRPPRTDQ